MDKSIKPLSRLLLLIILMSGLCLPVVVNCSEVKGVYAPSAPEFTLDYVESPYYVPPTYKIDQYTGKNVVDKQGYTVENKSIIITIKNQPFASYVNGTRCYMAYNVAYKGHFGEEWEGLEFRREYTMERFLSKGFPKASDSDYTVLRVPVSKYSYPENAQLDVKVQAYIGHEAVIHVIDYLPGKPFLVYVGEHDEDGIIFDTEGDWSEIQTITINVPTPADQLNDATSNEPDQINLILTGTFILIPIAAGLGILLYLNKRKHSN